MTAIDLDHAATHSATPAGAPYSTTTRRISWALTGLAMLFLVFDAISKLAHVQAVVDAFAQVGWAEHLITPVGLLLLGCVILHLIPRTTVLGAVLLTAYLGGAVATQVRAEQPLFGTVLFPVYFATVIWAALWMRDSRVRGLLQNPQ